MKIVVVCDHGNNRSVHFAHQLKYLGHDVLTAGLLKNSSITLNMLFNWSDTIIVTASNQLDFIPSFYKEKTKLWDVGEDIYHRPFNEKLLTIVKRIIRENPL